MKKKSLDFTAKRLVVPISEQVRRVISVADRRSCFNGIRRLPLIALISVKLSGWRLNHRHCWRTSVESVELEGKEAFCVCESFHKVFIKCGLQIIHMPTRSSEQCFLNSLVSSTFFVGLTNWINTHYSRSFRKSPSLSACRQQVPGSISYPLQHGG